MDFRNGINKAMTNHLLIISENMKNIRMDDIKGISQLLQTRLQFIGDRTLIGNSFTNCGNIFCPRCRDIRAVDIEIKYGTHIDRMGEDPLSIATVGNRVENLKPNEIFADDILYQMECRQCGCKGIGLALSRKNNASNLIIKYRESILEGTANIPTEISYYLAEAFQCRCAGAFSASAAMYRAA